MDDDKKKDYDQTADGFDFVGGLPSTDGTVKTEGDLISGFEPPKSNARPLTPRLGEDDEENGDKTPSPQAGVTTAPISLSGSVPSSDIFYEKDKPPTSELIDFSMGDEESMSSTAVPVSDQPVRHDAAVVSIDANRSCNPQTQDDEPTAAAPDKAPVIEKKIEVEEREGITKTPEIGEHLDAEPAAESRTEEHPKYGACETIAQQPTTTTAAKKKAAAMEGEVSASSSKSDGCCCPFSPVVFFHPDKLHPTVAEYVYWRDVKKSGICFSSTLLLLLSLKYFSLISVAAYLTLAVLAVTISFRIYKNVLQAVQKSNEGHPFKEYLDMDINLSHEKLKDASEVLIQHVNAVTNKLRSLILVEDLFDTLKLVVLAWCMTYIGAWFNGMTVIILGVVSAFTLPKVYETNKAQIDTYAEIIRVKCKEVMDMINAKMPLGKKKKDE